MMGKGAPLDRWPVDDRAAFTALFAGGGLLDDRGPLAHWRTVSRHTMQLQYSQWVHWVSQTEPEALHLDPVSRATRERLRTWLASMNHLAPPTLLGYLGALVRLCRSIEPDRDWRRHQAILADLQRATVRHSSPRKVGRIMSSDVLFEVGARLVQDNAGVTVPLISGHERIRGIPVGSCALNYWISTGCWRVVSKIISAHRSSSPRSAVSPSWLIACFAAARYSGLATLGLADLYAGD